MNFGNPHFAEPQWLWVAVFAPLALLALQRYAARARRKQLGQLADVSRLEALTRTHSTLRRHIKDAILVAAVAAIGLALARPQWGEQEDTTQLLGEDVVFLLDCSKSMLATDITPNRLQRAKYSIQDYVQNRSRGRVGLVAFAGQAFLQCPLTFDHQAFQDSLAVIDERTIPIGGTDIGRALDEGFRAMEKNSRRKLLILVTDGEDLEKGAIKTAEKLEKEGVVVFALGVGTPAGSEITLINEVGQVSLLYDGQGQIVRSKLDEATLTKVAQTTHGAYYPLGAAGEGLARVRVALDTLDIAVGPRGAKRSGVERFHWPVAIALLFLAGEPLLGTRRRLRET